MVALASWCFGFPYSPNEPIREAAWQLASDYYDLHFPGIPQLVHSATPQGDPFLRAATRNQLVQLADAYEVVVLVDADTLIHPDGITEMVQLASERRRFLGKPFLRSVDMPLSYMERISPTDWPKARSNDPGAAWVVRPEDWWAVGGMDDGFRSWGAEDDAFAFMFEAFGGNIQYHDHAAVKVKHPTARWSADPLWSETWSRYAVYRHISRHPALAGDWLKDRHRPGAVQEWIARHNINLGRRA